MAVCRLIKCSSSISIENCTVAAALNSDEAAKLKTNLIAIRKISLLTLSRALGNVDMKKFVLICLCILCDRVCIRSVHNAD